MNSRGRNPDDVALKWALRQAALRNRQWRRLEGGKETGTDGLIVPKGMPSPEHYHLVYNVPKDHLSLPHFADTYVMAREAYQKIFDLGMQAQPNCEFYDDGTIGLEMRIQGRADLWWVVLEVAACIRAACLNAVEREKRKRSFVIVPDGIE